MMSALRTASSQVALDMAIRLNLVLLLALVAMALFAPGDLLDGFGMGGATFAALGLIRLLAVLALVLAVLLWSARHWLQSTAGRPALGALTAAYGAGAVLISLQQMSVWSGQSGVVLMSGCILLTMAYGLAYWVARPDAAPEITITT